MSTIPVTQLKEKYIQLTKQFFKNLESGSTIDELQPLQEEIEKTMMQLDHAEKQQKENNN
jgi:hypothetical protein